MILAQLGDKYAFERLVVSHAPIAFRVAHLITRNAQDAEDVSQDAFIKCWLAIGRFRATEPLRPWLLRIVANEASNRRRAARRLTNRVLVTKSYSDATDESPSPEEQIMRSAEHERLLDGLKTLPEPARLVLACRYLLNLNERETAAVLGVRAGTVKSRTSRALERLREGSD